MSMWIIVDPAWCRAWIEASTKGAVLLFCAAEIENRGVDAGLSPGTAGLLGGMGGGIAQAYATMGFCTSEGGTHRARCVC